MTKKSIILISLVAVVSFALGVSATVGLASRTIWGKQQMAKILFSNMPAGVRPVLDQNGNPVSVRKPGQTNATSPSPYFVGKVKEINGNDISLESVIYSPNQAKAAVKSAHVNDQTKFYLLSLKNQTAFKKELADYNAALAASAKDPKLPKPTPPEPFTKTAVGLADLKVGQELGVQATQPIQSADQSFVAKEINILPPRTN